MSRLVNRRFDGGPDELRKRQIPSIGGTLPARTLLLCKSHLKPFAGCFLAGARRTPRSARSHGLPNHRVVGSLALLHEALTTDAHQGSLARSDDAHLALSSGHIAERLEFVVRHALNLVSYVRNVNGKSYVQNPPCVRTLGCVL